VRCHLPTLYQNKRKRPKRTCG